MAEENVKLDSQWTINKFTEIIEKCARGGYQAYIDSENELSPLSKVENAINEEYAKNIIRGNKRKNLQNQDEANGQKQDEISSDIKKVKEAISNLKNNFTPKRITAAIGVLVVLSKYFNTENEYIALKNFLNNKTLVDAINKKIQECSKSEKRKPTFPEEVIFKVWLIDLLEWWSQGDGSSQPGWLPYFGAYQFILFRKRIKESCTEINSAMTLQKACNIIVNYLANVAREDVQKNAKSIFKEIYEKLFDIKITVKEGVQNTMSYNGYKHKIVQILNDGATQVILTGAPGTGKTRMAIAIAKGEYEGNEDIKTEAEKCKGAELSWKEADKNGKRPQYELVQFHPSYDYTDFIEGLRPVESKNGSGNIEFKKIDGIFKNFCREVISKGDPEQKYYFIIDEINRADLSKVFGEIMFCLETDKRGEDHKVQTQYQNLKQYDKDGNNISNDVFKDGFYIPKNVYIIGTMNDIDRSVESIDFALRRRFLWQEIEVSRSLLSGALKNIFNNKSAAEEINESAAEEIAERIMKLNEVIYSNNSRGEKLGLNKQYYISQGQFANLPGQITELLKVNPKNKEDSDNAITDFLERVFELRIESLLKEYVRGENESEVTAFVEECKNKLLSNKNDSDNSGNSNDQDEGSEETQG